MFSNLASYLGYATSSAKPNVSQEENEQAEMRLHAVEEDDWILVERNENNKGFQEEIDEDAQMTRVTLSASTCPGALLGSSRAMSRSSSLDVLSPFQESWYLTPPPSFTSKGPVHMETSPLENLLIEHPSMSVYERSQRIDASKKMSNSSPSTAVTSEEEYPVVLSPIKEKIYKLPRNKLNDKLLKTQSTSNPKPVPIPPVPSETEEAKEVKEPKMKNFVKSPRRTINTELQNLPKKSLRKRPESGKTNEMISKTSTCEDVVVSEETNPILPNVQTRRLYSEVLASKPKVPTVQAAPSAPIKVEQLPPKFEPNPISSSPAEVVEEAASKSCESESVMTVEESVDEGTEESSGRSEDRDRKKAVQTLPDRQHRLHFLNRSAQKVEQRKTCDLMKKNPLIRTNKAREFNFRNKRQRRADMMQRHSGANNNRKCAKTSLY